MYKVLIIGCGRIAGHFSDSEIDRSEVRHAWVFKSHEGFEVSGCVDADRLRAENLAGKGGIPYWGDDVGKAMAEVRPDVVVIATPDETHFEVVCQVFRQHSFCPRIVFLEKPACADRSELDQLLDISHEQAVPIVVNQSRRFHLFYQKLRAEIRKGRFGTLTQVDSVYYGGWRHNAVHLVDIIRYISGLEFGKLDVLETISDGRVRDPTLTVRGALDSRVKIPVWFHGWDERIYQIFDLEFRFSKGRLRIGNFEREIVWEEAQVNSVGEKVLKQCSLKSWETKPEPLPNAVAGMYRYLQNGETDGLCQCLLSDIAESMRTTWKVGEIRNL